MTTSPRVVPSTSLIPVSGPKRKRRGLLRRVFSRGPGMVSIIFLAVLIIVSVIAPWIVPYDPNAIDLRAVLEPPSPAHWLGTDDLGRDVLSRLLVAGGVSLAATAQAVFVGLLFFAAGRSGGPEESEGNAAARWPGGSGEGRGGVPCF